MLENSAGGMAEVTDWKQLRDGGKALRAAITEKLSAGPATAADVAQAMGIDLLKARHCLYRMVDAGLVKVSRLPGGGKQSVIAMYGLVSAGPAATGARQVVIVRKEWEPLPVRLGIEWLLHGGQLAAA